MKSIPWRTKSVSKLENPNRELKVICMAYTNHSNGGSVSKLENPNRELKVEFFETTNVAEIQSFKTRKSQ